MFFGIENVIKQSKVGNTRKRWDFQVNYNNEIINIEFDGAQHYCDINIIISDKEKNLYAKSLNQKVIRIPYWIQLDKLMFKYYFGFEFDIETDYKHGFIDKKATLPASFCEIGVDRFLSELYQLPELIFSNVMDSLIDKIELYPNELFVIPKKIIDELSGNNSSIFR